MAKERTLSIIKPDATRRNLTGKINAKFEEAGLKIVAQRRVRLSAEQAGQFYAVHAVNTPTAVRPISGPHPARAEVLHGPLDRVIAM